MTEKKNWLASAPKKALPVITFPCAVPMGMTVREILSTAEKQAEGIAYCASHSDSLAAVSFMDLSVEAECFGAKVRFSDTEVPCVVGACVHDTEEAKALSVPEIGAGRTDIVIGAIRLAKEKITDRPVLAGMIGPISLAARLLDVTELLYDCCDEPDMVHTILRKATDFLKKYALALKNAGADGLLLAEPVAGLVSPDMEKEFSASYVKEIVAAVQDADFPVIYHNCGDHTKEMLPSFLENGAAAYHFGNSTNLSEVLKAVSPDIIVMGNLDAASVFRFGTPETVKRAAKELLESAGSYPNFIPSSGCDVPPGTAWENIDAFYEAVREYYGT